MCNNLEILNEWNKTISRYKTFTFSEAQALYREILDISDEGLKMKYNQELITGTLYVVSNFISSSGLLYMHSATYDMNDIISVCNEIWVDKINSGKLLRVKKFEDIFNINYCNRICDLLGLTRYLISEGTALDANTFISLFMDYTELKENDIDFNRSRFIEYVKSSRKYRKIIDRAYYYYDDFSLCVIFDAFDAIIKSFELGDEKLKISKAKLDKLKYIIINNGLEYIRANINNAVVDDMVDSYISDYCRKQVVDIILNSDLDEVSKGILFKRYGIFDDDCKTLDEVANDYGVSRERIRQKEAKALRKLRLPMYKKKFEGLM